MNIDFTARRVRLSPRVRDIVETKLRKLEKVLPQDAQARVVVFTERKNVAVEVTIVGRQRTWTATETGPDQESAVHAVLERIEAQAKKTKARVKEDKKHRGSPRGQAAFAEGDSAPARRSSGFRRESMPARPMFEEDALTAFTGSDREVFVFRDATDDAFRVLYRRRDGGLGLLIPV